MTKKKKPEELLPMGRPTDYRPEFCNEIIEFFDVELYKTTGYKKELNALPTLQAYAAKIRGVTVKTLHNWAAAHPDFLQAFERAKVMQENLLVQGGVSRAYDSGFTRFILNSVSDTYKEKVTIEADEETKGIVRLAYSLPVKKDE